MMKMGLLILIVLVSSPWIAMGQEIYRWVDEKGTVHFADDITLVPEKYRDRIQQRKLSETPSPPPATPFTGPEAAGSAAEPAAEKKDILGRDENWWRAKVKEWEDKLQNAQKNYDLVHHDLRQKEKELAEAKLKPDKFKRKSKKIETEIKTLDLNLKEWEKQIEEAKHMLQKVLPKQAIDYRADPAWLQPKE
jgi:hypothetical protein